MADWPLIFHPPGFSRTRLRVFPDSGTRRAGRLTARIIRASVRSSLIRHSHTRRTLHPSFRSFRLTRRSRRRFETIFRFQNDVLLLDGRSQRGQPCQKQPSTNRATRDFGHAKSGFPATGHCLLYPRIPRSRRSFSILTSVVPPEVRTAVMIFDRTLRVTLSMSSTAISEWRRTSNRRLGWNPPGRVDNAAPQRF